MARGEVLRRSRGAPCRRSPSVRRTKPGGLYVGWCDSCRAPSDSPPIKDRAHRTGSAGEESAKVVDPPGPRLRRRKLSLSIRLDQHPLSERRIRADDGREVGPFPDAIGPLWRRTVFARMRSADLESGPFVTLVRRRTIEKVDSMNR